MLHQRRLWPLLTSRNHSVQPSQRRTYRKSARVTKSPIASASGCKSASGVCHRRSHRHCATGPGGVRCASPPVRMGSSWRYPWSRASIWFNRPSPPTAPDVSGRPACLRTKSRNHSRSSRARRATASSSSSLAVRRNRSAIRADTSSARTSQSRRSRPLSSHSIGPPEGSTMVFKKSSAGCSPTKNGAGLDLVSAFCTAAPLQGSAPNCIVTA